LLTAGISRKGREGRYLFGYDDRIHLLFVGLKSKLIGTGAAITSIEKNKIEKQSRNAGYKQTGYEYNKRGIMLCILSFSLV